MIDIERCQGPCKPNSYIVKLRDTASKTSTITSLASQLGEDMITHNYDSSFFKAFAGIFGQSTLDILRESEDVEYIVEDSIYTTQGIVTQTDATWGLSRISQTSRLTNTDTSSLTYTYNYKDPAGEGVDIYVMDTGIYTAHEDFGERARWGATFGDYEDSDGNGHGTHCAGIAAGTKFGVAKKANVIAVKVLSDEERGAASDIIHGLEWIFQQVRATNRPSVVNMSVGGPVSRVLDHAVGRVTASGIHVVVATGAENSGTRTSSPSGAPGTITVGVTDINDAKAIFSNYGDAVDIFAPGVDIPSTWVGSPTATRVMRGTSMGAPYVAGYIAYLISVEGNKDPAVIKARMHELSTDNILTGIPRGINEIIRNDS